MKFLLATLFLASAPIQQDEPSTYLLSVVDVPLGPDESIRSFAFSTWGVTFNAICKLPSGWTIKAGRSLTPAGVLEGEGSLGTSWFNRNSPEELSGLVLVTFYGRIRPADVLFEEGSVIPASFKGAATISTVDGDREAELTSENIRLVPADRCP